MNNWYKQKAFFLILLSFFFSKSVEIVAYENSNSLDSNQWLEADSVDGKLFNRFIDEAWLYERNDVRRVQLISRHESILPSNNLGEIYEVNNWLARQQNSCQNINSAYKEVYSFETDNYYIKICQIEDSFYYHRQSKFDDDSTLLIPAQIVTKDGIFQADSRGTTYFVGRDSDRYYSSVMQNNNEIIFEPELRLSPDTVLARDLAEANSQLPDNDMKADRATNASLESHSEENLNRSQALICTESDADNSRISDWQQLLGESLDTANKYAVNNGHSFVYNAQAPEQALITTKEGAIVNLNIASNSNTIERVCIRSSAEN